jgi:chromosome partitioning protein
VSKILAITNQKGGVGKTTSSVNLAAALAEQGMQVLLVDLDPQGNATMGSGVDKNELMYSAYDILTGQVEPEQAIVHSETGHFDLLPSNADLTAAEVEMLSMMMKEHRLKISLKKLKEKYDYILIDCPPSLNMLTVNALVAAEGVLIPMQCEYYALEGISALLETVEQIKASLNPALELEGVVRTMYDPRSSLTNEVSSQLHDFFADRLYATVIPRNVKLAEAPSFGEPILKYDPGSRGAAAYRELAREMLQRHESPSRVSSEIAENQ